MHGPPIFHYHVCQLSLMYSHFNINGKCLARKTLIETPNHVKSQHPIHRKCLYDVQRDTEQYHFRLHTYQGESWLAMKKK